MSMMILCVTELKMFISLIFDVPSVGGSSSFSRVQPDTALVVARAIASVKVSAAGQVAGTKSNRERKI